MRRYRVYSNIKSLNPLLETLGLLCVEAFTLYHYLNLFTCKKGGFGNGRRRPQCIYCKRIGHTRGNCYSLHGFPNKSANISMTEGFNKKLTSAEYK